MTRVRYQFVLFFVLLFSATLQSQNCDHPVALADSCAVAPTFCKEYLKGYCSTTPAANDFNPTISNACPLENSIWVQVPVCETEVFLSFFVENCNLGLGVEVSLVSSDDCQNFIAANPGCNSIAPNTQTDIQFSNLTADELYYLVIDGAAADICDFSIDVISGIVGKDTIMIPDTSATTPLMWEIIVPARIEGDADGCNGSGNYKYIPPVCQLTEGDCMRSNGDSGTRALSPCDSIPTALCPPPIITTIQFDTIIHWDIPPCVVAIGDTNSFDLQLDFSNYLQCYFQSGMQPWPTDSIPFNISAEMELIPIPDTTTTNDQPDIFCDCPAGQALICNSCPSGADFPGSIKPDYVFIDHFVCPPCGDTPDGFLCVGDNFWDFPSPCSAINIFVLPHPTDPIDFGVIEICPGECVDVDGNIFCGAGSYNFITINQFGCEVDGFVMLIEFPVNDIDYGNIDMACNGDCVNVGTQTFCSTGFFTWTETDLNGCLYQASASITEPDAVTVTTNITNGDCNTCGSIEIIAFGGTSPFTYEWSGPGPNTNASIITVCVSGNYQVTVTDNNGCTVVTSATVNIDNSAPVINLVSSATTFNNTITEITLTCQTAPTSFEFYWDGPNGSIPANGNEITVTDPGNYLVTVVNPANGCSSSAFIELFNTVQPNPPQTLLGDSCLYAPFFCEEFLDSLFSNNSNGTHDSLDLIPGCAMENSVWLSFAACDTMAQLSFDVDSCAQMQGLEFSIVSTVACDSFELVGTTCQTITHGTLDTLTFDSLVVGNNYYLIIDGIDADICNFEIGVIGGVAGGLDSIPPVDSIEAYRLVQLTPGSIDGPTEVCAFSPTTYTFNPGTCAIEEGDCNMANSNSGNRSADGPCDIGCFAHVVDQFELDTIVDWTLPNGTTIIGDSTDFDINIEFGIDFLLDYYNGMIPTSDTDTIVVTLFADYSIIPLNDTITQDTLGPIYCNCPASTILCGSCSTGAQLDVQIIIIFNENPLTTCEDDCQDACGQQLCPGGFVYCSSPCMITTTSLELEPIIISQYTGEITCTQPCASTPYGIFCSPGIYTDNQPCSQVVITIVEVPPLPTDYGTVTLCPGECFTANDGQQFCTAGVNNFMEIDVNGCDAPSTVNIVFQSTNDIDLGTVFICEGDCYDGGNGPICVEGPNSWTENVNGCSTTYLINIEFYPNSIDYGTITLCPGDCYITNEGQAICDEGISVFSETSADNCLITATINIVFENVSDVDLGTVFLCDGECYPSNIGPICTPGPHNWTENINGCDVEYTLILEYFSVTPVDYGTVSLCVGECFTSNDGQQFCTDGIHNFTEIDQNNCAVPATVTLIISPTAAISTSPTTEICNATGSSYTVSFTIYGDPPYSVNNVEISGDFYTSGNINDGDNYYFEVKNSQAQCPSTVIVSGDYSCPLLCNSDPGMLYVTPSNSCTSQSVQIIEIDPVFIQDANFDFEYLLHEDPNPFTSQVLLRNKTGLFSFDQNILEAEKEYYSSRVVGLGNNNEVDLNGSCLKFTSGPTITFYKDAQLAIEPSNNLILNCSQPEIQLSALPTNGSGNWDFNWTNGGNISNGPMLTVDQAGIYNCELTDVTTGCTTNVQVEVFENFIQPSAAILSPQGMLECNIFELELNADVLPLDGQLTTEWIGPNGPIDVSSPNTAMAEEPGWYFINITHQVSGCTAVDSIEVMENENVPAAIITEIIQPDCYDDQFGVLEILDIDGGTAPYDLFFNGINTNELIENIPTGEHIISLVDQNGCTFEKVIEIITPDDLATNLQSMISVDYGTAVEINASLNFSPNTITWTDQAGNILGNEEVLNLDFYENQRISFSAIDENGCVLEDEVEILVKALEPQIFIPSAFSPNGDELNDYFELFGNQNVAQVDQLQIFDRWGALVFMADNYQLGDLIGRWDGRHFGKTLNPGVFVYQVSYTMIDGQKTTEFGDLLLLK